MEDDEPKKVFKNRLFLNALKDIKKNRSSPVLLPSTAISQKDTISDKNKSETETLPAASESICANDLNENKSRKNVELSSEFQHRNDKTNIDELSVTDQSNTLLETICRSDRSPTSNQKHFSSPSYKNGYVSPYQKKHSYGSRSEKYCKNSDKTENINKDLNKFKYHRSYSETDHSRRFSKSNKVPELYKESGDNWCFAASQETDARFSLNRNSNRYNSSSHNDYKSESNSADLDTWANYKESDLGVQHSIHENRHANYVQPKLKVNQETNVKYSLNRNNNRPNSFVLTSSHNDYKSESTSVDVDTWANYKEPDLDVQHSVHKNRFANNGQSNMSTSDFKSRRISKDLSIPVWNSHLQHSKYRQSESHLSCNVEPKIVKCKWKDDPEYNNFEILSSTTENFIPPPILPPTLVKANNQINSTCGAILDQNETTLHTITSDSTRGSDTNKEICSTLCEPDSKQLEAITAYVVEIVKRKSVSSSLADKVVRDLNSLFKNHLEGNVIDVYGSFYSNLAISTSDINLVMKSDTRVRSGFMTEVYKVLSREQEKYNVHPFEDERAAKILFSEPYSYVSCQLAYLGKKQESILKMGKFLRNISLHEQRVRTLIIAVKIWAEVCLINDAEGGQLHPVGFIMLMIHFLQHYEKPILPIPINFLPNGKLESSLPPTSSSVGELWVSFLKYFALIFNWSDNVVTVTSKETVSKKSKGWDTVWMAIEDPITGQNIAKNVVHSDTAEFIKASFKSSYAYFCNPPVDSLSRDSADESNEESRFEKWKYSFEQCMADQSEFFCEMCDNLGETCEECKKKICAPTLSPVPQMTEDFLKKIKDVLLYVNEKYVLTKKEVDERKQFVKNLQMEIRNINYDYRTAELSLFGSSVNGFGFKNGDLDICLTFKENCEKVKNSVFVLKDLLRFLRRKEDCDHPFLIYNATIPIVKFHYKPKEWRVDICVKNNLAVYNSRLLHTYTEIDPRCKILGCALRLLAKKAMIAEVTDKALSPYAYSIMVIHFLQQTNPPVLPVLQDPKLHKIHKLAEIVENCNIWFYEDIEKLECSKNDTPVEQLWLQMLDYYCSHDVKNQLITITQKEQLLLSDKQIKARLFNIQDPFIREKNLGSKVSQKMAAEIENVFLRARNLFRTPKDFPSGVKDMEDYFFSTMSLTGRIHKEALCDLCGKFGHEKKDCKKACIPVWRHPRFTHRMYPRNCTQIFKKS